jgi:hypothetical protein
MPNMAALADASGPAGCLGGGSFASPRPVSPQSPRRASTSHGDRLWGRKRGVLIAPDTTGSVPEGPRPPSRSSIACLPLGAPSFVAPSLDPASSLISPIRKRTRRY